MKKKEHGKIKGVELETVRGIQGFLIRFDTKEHMLGISRRRRMWISVELAHDLGFIPDKDKISKEYRKLFVGKKIAIID